MRRIAAITGTRADYGILRPVFKAIKTHQKLKLFIIATGMHFSKEFGLTVKEIERNGFKIHSKIDVLHREDSGKAMADSIGKCIQSIAESLDRIKPDLLLLLGDRSEMLAGAVAASYMNVPVAHVHGGEISGNVDEPVRHAITKLSHIHFPATNKSAERILKMGEDSRRIFKVGAPGIDSVLNEKLPPMLEITKKFDIDRKKPVALVVQHPVTTEVEEAESQIKKTLDAIVELKLESRLVYPNADAGGRRMIKIIRQYEDYPFIKTYKSLPHLDYLGLMKVADVTIGNSSSGIIEAPSFRLPVVNIGTRQNGRERSSNVIDVGYNKKEIKEAIKKALYDNNFKKKVIKCKNPYGDGRASVKIADILSKIKLDKTLLQKRMVY